MTLSRPVSRSTGSHRLRRLRFGHGTEVSVDPHQEQTAAPRRESTLGGARSVRELNADRTIAVCHEADRVGPRTDPQIHRRLDRARLVEMLRRIGGELHAAG